MAGYVNSLDGYIGITRKIKRTAKFIDWEIQDIVIFCHHWAQISPVQCDGVVTAVGCSRSQTGISQP
jgi:hypothetical protein